MYVSSLWCYIIRNVYRLVPSETNSIIHWIVKARGLMKKLASVNVYPSRDEDKRRTE